MDVSSDEAAKTYIWTISVRLAGYSGEEFTCVADTLNRLYTAPMPMVWTMRGPAATQSSEEYSYRTTTYYGLTTHLVLRNI